VEQSRQRLLSIAVVCRARERQPGSSEPGIGPRIGIFRDLRLNAKRESRHTSRPSARVEANETNRHVFDPGRHSALWVHE